MTDTLTGQPPAAPVAPHRRAWTVVQWTLVIVLAAQFAFAGATKIAGSQQMVDMFADLGAGQWLRIAIGVAELAGAVGLLIGRTRAAAALGLAALMVGATIARTAVLGGAPVVEVVFLILAGTVLVAGRRLRTQP